MTDDDDGNVPFHSLLLLVRIAIVCTAKSILFSYHSVKVYVRTTGERNFSSFGCSFEVTSITGSASVDSPEICVEKEREKRKRERERERGTRFIG